MPITQQIGISPTIAIALISATVGFAAFWSNPGRSVNRGFFAASLFVSFWLFCLDQVRHGGEEGQFWAEVTAITGASIFVPVWFIKEAILNDGESPARILFRSGWWIFACAALGTIRTANWSFGGINVSFWAFVSGLVSMYGILCRHTITEIRHQVGLKRLELQIALLGGCATGLTIMLLITIRALVDLAWITQLYPAVILLFYTGTVIAMTTSRVFNARQLLTFGLQKLALIASAATLAYVLYRTLSNVVAEPAAWFFAIGVALWFSTLFTEWLDRRLEFYPQGNAVRQAALSAAQRERRLETMEDAFKTVLTGWGHTERAVILSGNRQSLAGSGITVDGEDAVMRSMRSLKWATPERLARERSTPERLALAGFFEEKQLAILVLEEGFSLSVLVGVGPNASRRPYTYPQVTQLMELASIMESALERAHFSAKVQHTEQLATVGLLGASLAHEIRNPLVSIKTFVQLLPTHHQDPRFREKFFKLIGDEVGRIDQLTEQLLDLASPRTYEAKLIELHPLLRSSLDLVAAKAAHRNVRFLTDLQASPDAAFTDASAAKQVMLNLCFNAIQAVEAREAADRWVKIATRNTPAGIEMAVADSGPGIAPEIRPRLFQPFQTTKSSGFGLGLAICSDILANLNASISVDPPEPGHGATFRVTFPCQPLSS